MSDALARQETSAVGNSNGHARNSMPEDTGGNSPEFHAGWPLFYRKPELLSAEMHAHWRIGSTGVGFAEEANAVPVMTSEFTAVARHYPIVFSGEENVPVAVLGLKRRNKFVAGNAWKSGVYVPAYVRRYPFVFAEVGEPNGFVLAIDAEAPMVIKDGDGGQPLFEDGKPAPVTRKALEFCEAFARENNATREFVRMLIEERLLVERTASISLPEGGHSVLTGFSVVSTEAFAQLPEDCVVEWHRRGWLARVHSHLSSLDRFPDLLDD